MVPFGGDRQYFALESTELHESAFAVWEDFKEAFVDLRN